MTPLDFSEASHTALDFALTLSDRSGANLHLVHVLSPDSGISGLAEIPIIVPNVETGSRTRREMAGLAREHGAKLRPGALHVRRGSAFAEICNLAREENVDLIVISTRGHTGLKHLALGSTAERVVRHSPCPVLVVRDPGQPTKADSNRNAPVSRISSITRVLVPIDFSACSMKSLAYAKQVAKEFHATLILLHSIPLQYYITGDEYGRYNFPVLMQQSEKAVQKQMSDLVAETEREGIKANSSLQLGHPGQQICARAKAEEADIIITSTHGYTGLKHVLIGSTAEYVVRHAACPVLVVPTRERPEIK
jgi:nucleotide-binding universal stress UspA family protein